MNRYLGNKTDLLRPIMATIGQHARPGAWVCDAFAGTLSVAMELKRSGYRVACNDINLFSTMYGRAYLANGEVPAADLASLVGARRSRELLRGASETIEPLRGRDGFLFLEDAPRREHYERLVAIIDHLQGVRATDLPAKAQRSDIYDTYCEGGARSGFVSARGQVGRRRFFSDFNAKRIDAVLCQLRLWQRAGAIDELLYAMLVCVLIDAVERVSNTQGTYHDFPRNSYDARALKPLQLAPPPLDGVLGSSGHIVGNAEDSLEFVRRVPPHDVLYLDPPYNFRQYSAYYFLPNVIAKYADIDDLDDYFGRVEYVRGQNMNDDFDSPFCKRNRFLDALATLIDRARAKTIVLSYFDGRNHWNEFKRGANGVGLQKLTDFFSSPDFENGSLEVLPLDRLNYQSYGGYKARTIKEFLFVVRKANAAATRSRRRHPTIREIPSGTE